MNLLDRTFETARDRFTKYVETFTVAGVEPTPVLRKRIHTFEVCEISDAVSEAEGFCESERFDFRLCALFHDVSRFEQYRDYGTFRDADSFDHGERSAELISEKKFLAGLPENICRMVQESVRVHNKRVIPQDFPEEYLVPARMLRDADKLAIIKLVNEFFRHPEMGLADRTMKLDLPDTPSFNPALADVIMAGGTFAYTDMKSVNDFKINIFAWVNDLNFKASCKYALAHRYYERLRGLLPESEKLDELLKFTLSALAKQSASASASTSTFEETHP